jgi:NAD(P)-dependent dehydrogenase (short-subunit alcohol dehydrogenase family)
MSRIFVTGSADGLGLMAAQLLLKDGHAVTLHARSDARAADAKRLSPGAEGVVVGDFTTLSGMRSVAEQANASGRFDAVIHNAAVGYQEPRIRTEDGLEHVFAVNVLAPYVLTALMTRSSRLVYLSSGMHRGGDADLDDLQWEKRRWSGSQAYANSKFLDTLLAFAVARLWPSVRSNSVDPGWVATKMGGAGAPDDLSQGAVTQAWLAASNDAGATATGRHFFHRRERASHPAANDPKLQDAFLDRCAAASGVLFPRA